MTGRENQTTSFNPFSTSFSRIVINTQAELNKFKDEYDQTSIAAHRNRDKIASFQPHRIIAEPAKPKETLVRVEEHPHIHHPPPNPPELQFTQAQHKTRKSQKLPLTRSNISLNHLQQDGSLIGLGHRNNEFTYRCGARRPRAWEGPC